MRNAVIINTKVLLRSDLYFDGWFAFVTVHTSKTIQFQERIFSLPLPHVPGSLLCPVSALLNHFRINDVPSGALLFSVWSQGQMHLVTYEHFSSFLTKVLKSAGLDSTYYSPHSFCRGGATFTFESSVPSELIKVQGDWHSDCYYLEMSDSQKRFVASRMAIFSLHLYQCVAIGFNFIP